MGRVQTEQAYCWGWSFKELGKTHPEELLWGHRSRPYHPCLHSLARPVRFCSSFPWFYHFFGPPSVNLQSNRLNGAGTPEGILIYFLLKWVMMALHFSMDSILAKPTPLLVLLVSQRIWVERTWPKGFSIPSSSCLFIDSGRFGMCTFVGSYFCCFAIFAYILLVFSAVTFCVAEELSRSTKHSLCICLWSCPGWL